MRSILAESRNYIIMNEYEKVFLIVRNNRRKITIGDFYGDPEAAIISPDESFCVVGCGLIIYYLHEPYKEFEYNMLTKQWKELFRKDEEIWWIEDVRNLDDSTIMFTVEEIDTTNCDRYILNVKSLKLTKCVD